MKANFVIKHYASDQWPIAKSDVGIELEISGADREQAEEIALALNSHDELVEVVQEVGEAMTNIPGGYGYYIDRMRSALAKAGVSVEW